MARFQAPPYISAVNQGLVTPGAAGLTAWGSRSSITKSRPPKDCREVLGPEGRWRAHLTHQRFRDTEEAGLAAQGEHQAEAGVRECVCSCVCNVHGRGGGGEGFRVRSSRKKCFRKLK